MPGGSVTYETAPVSAAVAEARARRADLNMVSAFFLFLKYSYSVVLVSRLMFCVLYALCYEQSYHSRLVLVLLLYVW